MHIDVCAIPSFDIQRRPLINHYDIVVPTEGDLGSGTIASRKHWPTQANCVGVSGNGVLNLVISGILFGYKQRGIDFI